MPKRINFSSLARKARLRDQYKKQLNRLAGEKKQTDCIDDAVVGVMENIKSGSRRALVVYGDPQSGKTEMMICLTARLLDVGHKIVVHLLNDSVDLLSQNLDRFRLAGLAPAPRSVADLVHSPLPRGHSAVIFCKKNGRDLTKLIDALKHSGRVVVMDDEADYATPNAKINKSQKTRINALVGRLLGADGIYIGVTATPARLNVNNTFNNRAEMWVNFRPHDDYTGQDTFFPLSGTPKYRLNQLSGQGTSADAQGALVRFLVTVAHLNVEATRQGKPEQNYTFLVHTSGSTAVHRADRIAIERAVTALIAQRGTAYKRLARLVYDTARRLYGQPNAKNLAAYVIANASRSAFVVLNSQRDRKSAGDRPTLPTCPFIVIIGGNIVSRGVTFPNLLSMYFTRDVKNKMQQDTYIQRARMFGSRGEYLQHFELTIPRPLYADWHRCFVFHRLALEAIRNNKVSPVWIGDPRISIVASSSIDRGTVDLNQGEMSFQIFDCKKNLARLDAIVEKAPTDLTTLKKLATAIGPALPNYLIKYLGSALKTQPGGLAIHTAGSIARYGKSADKTAISRKRGFLGANQLEAGRFPGAQHHVKIMHNGAGRARVFYKNLGGVQFVQNQKK